MNRHQFAQEVLLHKERLWGFALQLTRNQAEAEDLLQLTYLRAFERWEQLKELDRARSWLLRTMHRAFVDRYRRQTRFPMESFEQMLETMAPPVDPRTNQLRRAEARDILKKALGELTPNLAQALTLRDVWGFSYGEIAELMDCPIGTVRSRIARARAQVLEMLKRSEVLTITMTQSRRSSS